MKINLKRPRFLIIFFLIFLLALALRTFKLASVPAGLHQDEAWFAYNGFLLYKTGANIYSEKWPLTVDMWGDHVSAVHSYAEIPFIALFGVNTFAFRLTFTFFSLGCLLLGAYLIYLLTKNKLLVLAFSLLFAISPWNLVMSRASSSVIIDTFFLLILIIVYLKTINWAIIQNSWDNKNKLKFALALFGSYLLTLVCYITYFTSRLLIPPFLFSMLLFVFWGKKFNKKIFLSGLAIIILYLIFPFAILLNSEYAQGRFKETTTINSKTVGINLYNDITNSGHAGLPVIVTRSLYNKVTENLRPIAYFYFNLISPSTLLFQNGPPKRYFVPNGSSLSLIEYLGIFTVFGLILLWKGNKRLKKVSLLLFFWLIILPVPSALTLDDYPNLQRAVIATPFVQMVAAIGCFLLFKRILVYLKIKKIWQSGIFLGLIFIFSLPTFVHFFFGYFYLAKFYEPYYRSRAGEELAKWINQNAHDEILLSDHEAGTFFYPYLFNQENINDYQIKKNGKYFLSAEWFQIGNRTFVKGLCDSPLLKKKNYKYAIVYTLHKPCDNADKNMVKIFSAKYDDGVEGFAVYRHKYKGEL